MKPVSNGLHNGIRAAGAVSNGWYGIRLERAERVLFIPLRRCHLEALKQWVLRRFVLTYEHDQLVVAAFFECVGQKVNSEHLLDAVFTFSSQCGGFVSRDHFLPVAIAEVFFELQL